MIAIYTTTTCPKCKILKKKLDDKKIKYEEINDEELLRKMGIMSVPIMIVDGRLYEFADAIQYVNGR